ncbi:putative metal-dependent hydrolase with the TIM-barrel fold [Halobacteroides halobius DSM 5150]|uniref:Putative metal-dependent hydrolase with the TIM-barrel fold n=1 Tax=Halobacteroides halobius (strain ATCC 35273 / DSM 5150 / MD-1) TaxID=748449 RepID=L0K664_HALHC|nr:phosphotriesterase-related protein [Halobacteroides halobius]AGB40757.1 putative metal-dependent hydrolase with the TIM-barrel fold [Halobacteroides halobius DSM 5150]
MKETINTLNGEISSDDLGVVRMHEHLLTDPPQFVAKEDPDLVLDSSRKATEELRKLGTNTEVKTLVDGTAIDYGRNVRGMHEIAKTTDLNIIATTGFNRGIFFEEWIHNYSLDELTDLLIREITEGMEGTNLKAGILKAGSDYNRITKVEEKTIRAVARAHSVTGAPIKTHTEMGTMGHEQLDIFAEEGVDFSQIVLIHIDRNLDYGYHKSILERGANIMYDGPSKIKYYTDERRIINLKKLANDGFINQLFISNDMGRKSYLKSYGGGPGWEYLHNKFIPRLLREGFNKSQIKQIFIENPKRFLAF